MDTFVVDIKSQNICIDAIKDHIRNKSLQSQHILILTKYYQDYYEYIYEHVPHVLTNIIMEYIREIHNIDCKMTNISDNHYQLIIKNDELNIDFNIFMAYKNYICIYDLIIKKIAILIGESYDHTYFVNYYLSKKKINMYLIVNNSHDCGLINEYDIIIKHINHDQFMNELIVIEVLFNQLNLIKIEK